jgi:hypothetical protein
MLGRKVEWKSSFRDYAGVVVEQRGNDCTVHEFNDHDHYTVAFNTLRVTGLSVKEFATVRRKALLNNVHESDKEGAVHDLVIEELEGLRGDAKYNAAIRSAIESEIKLKAAAQRVSVNKQSDSKFSARFSCDDSKGNSTGNVHAGT